MEISVEISLYPLTEKYEKSILDFIERLNNYKQIKVITNAMSTQIFGKYDDVFQILQKEVKITYKQEGKEIFVMKFFNKNLSN